VAEVRPLHGVRFDRRYSGSVGPLIAPPYDVIDGASRLSDYGIGLIENVEVGDVSDQHVLAAARYRNWRTRGILRRDIAPAFYVHRHRFEHDGTESVRTGLFARVRLTDWSERAVLPHERTTAGPRTERLHRLRAVGANLSPLYLLFRDPTGALRELLSDDPARDMPFNERDLMGGWHQLTALRSPEIQKSVANLLQERSLFMADGHHRYEAALSYRNERRLLTGADRDQESEFVLVLLAAVEDEGVRIRPIHRVIELDTGQDVDGLVELLKRWFVLRPARDSIAQESETNYLFRVVLPADRGTWDVLRRPDNPLDCLMPADKGKAWRLLPIASMQVVLQSAYGNRAVDGTPEIQLTLDGEDATRRVHQDAARAAFLMPTPQLSQVLEVAEEGDLMPAKSTWFEPKAPAGLVINEIGSTGS
jgi:uncharacterized protein (DUF1015 family)